MSGFVAAVGQLEEESWSRILGDLTFARSDTRQVWSDARNAVRLARVTRDAREPLAPQHGSVVVARGSVATDEQRIARAYAESGIDSARDFSGDFVFALYDVARSRLVVACDVVGGETVAYFWNGSSLVVSTRLLALLRHPEAPRRFDRVYRAHALSDFWSQAPGSTAFESVRRLRPGFALVLERGALEERRIDWLRLDRSPDRSLHGTAARDAFLRRLDDVVRERVPPSTCIALSGGLDSTVVASSLTRIFGSIDALSIEDSVRPSSVKWPRFARSPSASRSACTPSMPQRPRSSAMLRRNHS